MRRCLSACAAWENPAGERIERPVWSRWFPLGSLTPVQVRTTYSRWVTSGKYGPESLCHCLLHYVFLWCSGSQEVGEWPELLNTPAADGALGPALMGFRWSKANKKQCTCLRCWLSCALSLNNSEIILNKPLQIYKFASNYKGKTPV